MSLIYTISWFCTFFRAPSCRPQRFVWSEARPWWWSARPNDRHRWRVFILKQRGRAHGQVSGAFEDDHIRVSIHINSYPIHFNFNSYVFGFGPNNFVNDSSRIVWVFSFQNVLKSKLISSGSCIYTTILYVLLCFVTDTRTYEYINISVYIFR